MIDLRKLLYLIAVFFLNSNTSSAQNLFQNDKFTYAPIFEDKVVLLKQIEVKNRNSDNNFEKASIWAKNTFGKDLFVSSTRIREKEKKIYIQSKISLLLPLNKNNIRENVSMSYRLQLIILNDKCVIEIKDINYSLHKVVGIRLLRKYYSAEEIIAEKALEIDDNLYELRHNIMLSTFQFFNQLIDEFSENLN